MARRAKRMRKAGRDLSRISNRRLPRPSSLLRSSRVLPAIEDRRLYTPSFHTAARLRGKARVTAKKPNTKMRLFRPRFEALSFRKPRHVIICIRRQQRREVMHAKGVAGSTGLRKPRRSQYSNIGCK